MKEYFTSDEFFNPADIIYDLKSEKIGIIPTDTVYGLIGIAASQAVKQKIYKIKQRSFAKSLVVQVGRNYDLTKIAKNISIEAKKLMQNFSPGALTLIFEASHEFKQKYAWEIETVAVRIPRHNLLLQILESLNEPVFITSANISGFDSVNNLNQLKIIFKNVDFIVDDGEKYETVPSTIVDVSKEKIAIVREGVIKKDDIFKVASGKN